MIEDEKSQGTMRIANEVVAIVAGLAAIEVEGLAAMSGGIAGGIAEMLGRKNLTKGVKIEEGEDEVDIELYVVMEYGVSIPEVTRTVQQDVKNAVESITGIGVNSINVNIQGVNFPQEEEEEIAEEEEQKN